jgi:hypothetical protein
MSFELSLGHYIVYQGLEKYADPGAPDATILDPNTGERIPGLIRIEGLPEYPQLCAGLEIGAIYTWERAWFFEQIEPSGKYFGFLSKLAEMVGHRETTMWHAKRTPFYELLRFGLQRAHFGPEVVNRLRDEFDAWDTRARSFSDDEFYLDYGHITVLIAQATGGTLLYNGATEFRPYQFRQEWRRTLPNPFHDDGAI